MGKITDALKRAAEERLERMERIEKIKKRDQMVIRKMKESKVDSRIIAYFDPKAVISEQYKILRTNLLSLNKGRAHKVIVMTSAVHSEGKTVTSLNLSFVLAQSISKPKILLIDADLRRGRVHKYLGIEQTKGFSEVLAGEASVEDVVFKLDVDNLTFMTSGKYPHNPAEILGSDALKNVLEDVRCEFDFVIVDTPPIISVTDAGLIGAQSDGAVLIVQAGRTQRGVAKRAKELLHQAHADVLGHVLTNIEYHLPEYIYRYL